MGRDFWWYVEGFSDGVWRSPRPGRCRLDPALAFAFTPGHRRAMDVFIGPSAVLPLTPGLPPGPSAYELPDGADEPEDVFWARYEDLLVDLWETNEVLVTGRVPAAHALLFGDGNGPFPGSALRAAGFADERVVRLRDGHLADRPVDRSFGKGRHEALSAHPEHALMVTWVDSIAGLLGEHLVRAFRAASRAPGDRHRILLAWR